MIGGGGLSGAGAGLGGAIGGIIAMATDKGLPDEYKEIVQLWRNLQTPEFDMSDITPAQMRVVAELAPRTYETHIAGPVQLAQDSREGREAQLGSLRYLQQVQREGLPEADRIMAETAQRRMADEYSRANDALFANLKARGRLGGGDELAARVGLNQGAANLARDQGNALALEAVRRKFNAATGAGDLGSRVRGQDIALSQSNAGAMNRFNEFVSSLQTTANRHVAEEAARTDAWNAQNRQRIADTNEASRYAGQNENLNRRNRLIQAGYDNERARIAGLGGALGQLGYAKDAREAARQQNIRQIGQGIGGAVGSAAGFGLG